jgi:xylulose-5-phosphate/fructose-6-phosphate phosphoketolase
VKGDDPAHVHQMFAATLDRCYDHIRDIQQDARQHGVFERPRWPESSCARQRAGLVRRWLATTRSRAPSARTRCRWGTRATTPMQFAQLETWLRSYHPDELFDADGRLNSDVASLAPRGTGA